MSGLDTDVHDETDIDDEISVLSLTEADAKAIDTSNKDEPFSQKLIASSNPTHEEYPISRETFLRGQGNDPDCQNYATFVPKVYSNITYDTEGYLVHIARPDGSLQKILTTSPR